jgi:hypothetical protein
MHPPAGVQPPGSSAVRDSVGHGATIPAFGVLAAIPRTVLAHLVVLDNCRGYSHFTLTLLVQVHEIGIVAPTDP